MTLPFRRSALAAGLSVLISAPLVAQELLPPPKPVVTPEPGVRVAEQGPIHEGFAQPGAQVRGKDLVAPKAPPPPVPELPPETKPAGNDVRWVPGYWMWEDGKQDFTWVSGFWRDVPPGREWSAGEWKKSGDKYRFEPGHWRPANANQWRIDLPEPPKPLNMEPNTPAPHKGMQWVPGGWVYNDSTGQYAWQAGTWADPPGNMVYEPGQYRPTDYGYAYTPGYWDYCLENRGLLYAPVYFDRPLWNNRGWYYRPRYALNVGYGTGWGNGALFTSLSIGPGFGSYYYGPYGSGWSVGLGFGFGWGGFPGYGTYPYNYPWYYSGGGYYNSHWNHYNQMNAHNPAYPAQHQQAAAAAALGYNGVQSVVPLSRTTTPIITGAGTAGPPVVQMPTNTAMVASPRLNTTTQQKLVLPAQQVLAQQRTARPASPTVQTNPVFPSQSTNAIGMGMSGQPQPFRTDIGTFTPGTVGGPGIGPVSGIRGQGTTGAGVGGPVMTPRPGGTVTTPRPGGTVTTPRPTGPTTTGRPAGGGGPTAGGSRGSRGRG